MANSQIKGIFDLLIWILSGIALANYMLFGTKLGILSSVLQFDTKPSFSIVEIIYNSSVIFALISILFLIFRKKHLLLRNIYFICISSILGMSIINIWQIQMEMPRIEQAVIASTKRDEKKQTQINKSDTIAHFTLSKQGKNVIVLMLDRAISSYLPYIFQEKPALERQFAGFTYYPNSISFGGFTNFGVPAIYGGYEYTPVEMNRRADEPLVNKHNEALKVMPVLFDNADFDVTVCDPPYANYTWLPDLSIYDEYPRIKKYLTEQGEFLFTLLSEDEQKHQLNQIWERNFFCYSLMKISPLVIQPSFYQSGTYYASTFLNCHTTQNIEGISKAVGRKYSFIKSYAVLYSLPDMTSITDDMQNTFLLMSNSATHEPPLLQEPEYAIATIVDNTEFDNDHQNRFIMNGRQMHVDTAWQMQHYHANMAAMIQLGRWMDYLREHDVYDNTKIIIVADHGRTLNQFEDMIIWPATDSSVDIMAYNPLFLVKDFNSQEFTTDITFMTHADVPTLACKDLIANPMNPFTHKPINSEPKHASKQFITGSSMWDININNGNTFLPAIWYSVHDNVFNPNNWENMGEH